MDKTVRNFSPLLVAGLLAGCVTASEPTGWASQNGDPPNPARMNAARRECQREASAEVAMVQIGVNRQESFDQIFQICMTRHGYPSRPS